jgi:DNA-binding MarR family transcriptional regulator
MQLLEEETDMQASAEQAALEVLDVVPAIMRAIRAEMRQHRANELNVPQFRTLAYLDRHAGVSLSDVAEHIGLTLPSMSKLVDGLAARKLVSRQVHTGDRRRVTLALTGRGRDLLEATYESTAAYLAERLARVSETDRETIIRSMQLLSPLFGPEREAKLEPALLAGNQS